MPFLKFDMALLERNFQLNSSRQMLTGMSHSVTLLRDANFFTSPKLGLVARYGERFWKVLYPGP